jgi:hypothetical protein
MSPHPRFAPFASLFIPFAVLLFVIALTLATSSGTLTAAPDGQTSAPLLPLDSPIIINEMMPLVKQGEFQWVELFNNSASLFLPR